ncbi:hypothetical protein [Rubinisphaera margarita]|uniref:hypothetical protein n=1 Tax=Rubinisphaera margarita TaxID=2909586 RepID=UPI001EE87582|nr:hypothetical protein [Rubinisphaera margarita]MCG6157657.1 hypothetical protein [Rubinisphaera margarita]
MSACFNCCRNRVRSGVPARPCFLPLLASLMAVWLGVVMLGSVTQAQETPAPDAQAASETPPETPASTDAAAEQPAGGNDAAEEGAQPGPVDHLIYIPYDRLSDVIDRLKSKVVLSYEEYLDLVRRAEQGQEGTDPQSAAVISRATYVGTVKGEVAEITATFECRALAKKWAALPVNFGDAAVGEIKTSAGESVLLRGTGAGTYELLFPTAGEYTVTVSLLKKIKQSPSGPTLELTVPSVGITTFQLTVPKTNQKIQISPRHLEVPLPAPPEGDVSAIAVSLGAIDRVIASWAPDVSDRPEMDLLTTVNNQLQVTVGEGLIHTSAKLSYRVLRGELQTMRIAVPKGDRILDVTSSTRLEGWTVAQEDQRQVIEIKLLAPVEGSCEVEIHTERSLSEENVSLAGIGENGAAHGIHSLDVTREQGQIALMHGEELNLVVQQQAGLVRTDLGEKSDAQLAFRYFSPRIELVVKAEPVQPILDVKLDSLVVFREQRIELVSSLSYDITKAGLFQLQLKIPEGFELTNVECAQMAEYQLDEQSRVLTLALKERTQGNVAVGIRGYVPPPEGYLQGETAELDNLPLFEPMGVRQEEGRIGVFTIEAIELAAEESQIRNAQSIPNSELGDYHFRDTQIRAAWKYQTRPVEIPVRTVRRPTRLTAEAATTVQVQPSGISVNTEVWFHVQYAGVDQFRIAVPREYSSQIEIETADKSSVPIQQKTPEQAEEESPWVVWLIQTQRPATGWQRFRLTYDISLQSGQEAAENEADPAATPPRNETLLIPKALGLARPAGREIELIRSSGEVVVQTDPALSVLVQGEGAGLEPIDVRELNRLPSNGHQAFRYPFQKDEEPIQLALTVSRYDVAEVVSTVVSRMLTEFVIGNSTDVAVRSRLQVRSSQRQRLLIQLPESAQPMVVQIDGETRVLQRGEESSDADLVNYVLNVSRSKSSDEPFLLTLQYLMTGQELSESTLRGAAEFPLPRLLTASENAAVVQESRCIVWLPERYVPVRAELPFRRISASRSASISTGIQNDTYYVDQTKWLATPGGAVNFPTEGVPYIYTAVGSSESLELSYWNRDYVTALLTLLLLVIALVLVKSTWENKILVLLVAATILAAVLQFMPDLVEEAVYSARFGIVILLLVWFVHGLFQLRYCCRPSEPETEYAELDDRSLHDDEPPHRDQEGQV